MNKPFQRRGAIWQLSGFTRTHYWGVWVVSTTFVVAGILLAAYSMLAPESEATRILLFAICVLLVGCATILSSLLALLFYIGSYLKIEDESPDA